MSKRAMENLRDDHQTIVRALDVLKEMTDRIDSNAQLDRSDMKLLLEFFRDFVHNYHDGKEQSILLPALIAAGQRVPGGPLARMIADHREIHANIDAIEATFATTNDKDFAELAKRYAAALAEHLLNEDQFLFEAMDRILDDVTDRRLAKQFNDFEPGLRERSLAKFDNAVRLLAEKYGAAI